MNDIYSKIIVEDRSELILHGEDKEYFIVLSNHQLNKVITQAKHVHKALQKVQDHYNTLTHITWDHACESAAQQLFNHFEGKTVQLWFLSYVNNRNKFRVSNQGLFKSFNNIFLFGIDNEPRKRDNEDAWLKIRKWVLKN